MQCVQQTHSKKQKILSQKCVLPLPSGLSFVAPGKCCGKDGGVVFSESSIAAASS